MNVMSVTRVQSNARSFFAMLIVLMLAHLLSGSPLQSVDQQYQSTDLASPIEAVSKRAIRDLHTAAANAPDQCLHNVRFQEMMHSLLEEEMKRLQRCSAYN